jgi:hypothetical protein
VGNTARYLDLINITFNDTSLIHNLPTVSILLDLLIAFLVTSCEAAGHFSKLWIIRAFLRLQWLLWDRMKGLLLLIMSRY